MTIIQKLAQKIHNSNTQIKIVFPEGHNSRIQEAVKVIVKEKNIKPVLIFKTKSMVTSEMESLANAHKIDMHIIETSPLTKQLSNTLFELRKDKGMTADMADKLVQEVNYFSTLLLATHKVDGLVGGIEMTTAWTLKPVLQLIKSKGNKMVSSAFIMEKGEELMLFGDCAVTVDPNPQQLKDIAESMGVFAESLGFDRIDIAMLSYSTNGSGAGASVDKVKQAIDLIKADSEFKYSVDCEYQFDAAYVPKVRAQKAPNSSIDKNKSANIFVFPNLDSGNIGYKIAQRLGGYEAIGPIIIGLPVPANDLSRGASAEDVVSVAFITAAQALNSKK